MPYRFSTLAWLVTKMLDQLGYKQVDVLGISWGGGLAQQFALQHGKRCRRLVLASTGTGTIMIPGHPPSFLKWRRPGAIRIHLTWRRLPQASMVVTCDRLPSS